MDENAYRATYDDVNPLDCPFEKAILRGCCACELSLKLNIAEREAVACKSPVARENCGTLRELLRHNAQFTLKLHHADEALPYAKEIKVQCGGLRGLLHVIEPDPVGAVRPVQNVHGLMLAAHERFGSFEDLPYSEIVKAIAVFEARPKR
jgi:hypothetical protein